MSPQLVSQRTLVRLMEAMQAVSSAQRFGHTYYRNKYWRRVLFEFEFDDRFIETATSGSKYNSDWDDVVMSLRKGEFPIASGYRPPQRTFEELLEKLVAVVVKRFPDHAVRLLASLRLDGFDVDLDATRIVRIEGPVSYTEEEDRFERLLKTSGLPHAGVVAKHLTDAGEAYRMAKYHPALNEAGSALQAIIDGVSAATDQSGKHKIGLPSGTANRIQYLKDVVFFSQDEALVFSAAWGFLSAGSHPGVPPEEQSRASMIVALELAQVLALKFESWKRGGFANFA